MAMCEYRAKAYYQPNGFNKGGSTNLYSGHVTLEHAEKLLDGFLAVCGVTGGHIERHIQGVGWCLADDDSAEIERRRIDVDSIPPYGLDGNACW